MFNTTTIKRLSVVFYPDTMTKISLPKVVPKLYLYHIVAERHYRCFTEMMFRSAQELSSSR